MLAFPVRYAVKLKTIMVCFFHLCSKTDFLFAEVENPKVILGILFWVLNEHNVQAWENKSRWFFFFFCSILFAFLENSCFVCISMGNGPVEGAITSILKHWHVNFSHTQFCFVLFFFLMFAKNVTPLSWNIINLIPLWSSTSKYEKSTFSKWLYKGDFPLTSVLKLV